MQWYASCLEGTCAGCGREAFNCDIHVIRMSQASHMHGYYYEIFILNVDMYDIVIYYPLKL